MSDKELMNEELTKVIGGANMSAAQFQSACATLSDAQIQSLVTSMSQSQLQQLLSAINDEALGSRLVPILKDSGYESMVAIVIKPTV